MSEDGLENNNCDEKSIMDKIRDMSRMKKHFLAAAMGVATGVAIVTTPLWLAAISVFAMCETIDRYQKDVPGDYSFNFNNMYAAVTGVIAGIALSTYVMIVNDIGVDVRTQDGQRIENTDIVVPAQKIAAKPY